MDETNKPVGRFDTNDFGSSSKKDTPTGKMGTRAQKTAKVFPLLPTISIEEPPQVAEMPEKLSSSSYSPEKEETQEEKSNKIHEKEVEVKLERNNSLESIPSLDDDSESVSLELKQGDSGSDSNGENGSLSSYSSGHNKTTRRGRKAMSLGQVHLASSLRRRRAQISSKRLRNTKSEEGSFGEIQAEELERRLKELAAAFSARTIRTKAKIQQPPTPSSEESETEDSRAGEPTLLERLRKLASPGPSSFGDSSRRKSIVSEKVKGTFLENVDYIYNFISCNYILDPQSSIYVSWLVVVSLVFLYNAWVIPLRVVFPYQTKSNEGIWLILDSIADLIYLVDVFVFKPHVKFLEHGFWVKEPGQTMRSYLGSLQCKIDLIALFPADIVVYFLYGNMPGLRLPRIFKIATLWELFRQLDTILAHPHRARIFHTCLYMVYMIHMVACMYYALSTWEGIGTTSWTFDGIGNAYVRCFYFATKTATSIGKNPKPENELEYVFMTFAWLSGVFVFAILIGQIRDIIATATKSQTEYRILTSATVSYLHRLGVPRRLQDRVTLWLSYTWEQQKTLDETRILNLLPKSMKAEIALNIHVETLGKVQLFQDCETAFLQDLVVKLRSIIILPGDFVCRKGEIGREMFIVKSGKIHVIGGPSGTHILASLGEGSVFGEIALLGIGGMNKRTADVRAAGFVNLFVLNKADLNDVIRDYPEAQQIMQRKAKKLMRENIKKARATPSPAETPADGISLVEESDVIIKNKEEAPQLIHAMMKLFPPTTKIGRYLRKGSKEDALSDMNRDWNPNDSEVEEELDYYTSLRSYPPSPFIPISPGHISQELDISIMTGDSLEKLLSPPIEPQNSLELSIPENEDDQAATDPHQYPELGPCQSSLPPFAREKDIKSFLDTPSIPPEMGSLSVFYLDKEKESRKSCPEVETFVDADREEIPIEFLPPLCNIQGRGSGGGGKRNSSANSRILRQIILQQDSSASASASLEEEAGVSYYEKNESKNGPARDRDTGSKDLAASSSSRAALIAHGFIHRVRGPLERQREVEIVDGGENASSQTKETPAESPQSYSLDIESD